MKTMKTNYAKPVITVIDVEPQQMICSSPGNDPDSQNSAAMRLEFDTDEPD